VEHFIESGLYGNQSEVVRAGLRLLHEREQEQAAKLDALRRDINVGLKQIRTGEGSYVTAEEFKERGRQLLPKKIRQQSA
jgi:antitoxin ParD1/3/4